MTGQGGNVRENVEGSTGRNPTVAVQGCSDGTRRDAHKRVTCYFVLKLRDSRKPGLQPELRFDKLFEALDIVCRFVPGPGQKWNWMKPPGMALRVKFAVERLPKSIKDEIRAAVHTDVLLESIRSLNERILPLLASERDTPGYTPAAVAEVDRSISFFTGNLARFENSRKSDWIMAAVAILTYCVTLRNCRFHGYFSTSGDEVGYQVLLSPLCDAQERLLVMLGDHILDKTGDQGIWARIQDLDAIMRDEGERRGPSAGEPLSGGESPLRGRREIEERALMAERTALREGRHGTERTGK